MKIELGDGKTEKGTGVQIHLSGDEIARAIMAYLTAHGVYITGPRSLRINGNPVRFGELYVDPSGRVIAAGVGYNGKGYIE